MANHGTRRRDALLGFEALSIEGGLLAPEWLAKISRLEAGSQAPADYRVPKGLDLRDDIGRYWRIAQAHWAEFSVLVGSTADQRALAERFVTALLKDAFGFESLKVVPPVQAQDRTYPIGHAAVGGRVPVVIAPAAFKLDTQSPAFGEEGRRRSAFGLVQECLNAGPDAGWGIASDGVILRIVRHNPSLTRPAWIEADLGRIFTEERFADFAAMWLLAHESRFGKEDGKPSDAPLEVWRNAGREEGTRALGKLRGGVTDALQALGQGFIAHPQNAALRADLESGALSGRDYFNQLLRLVYRLIFLLTAEDRDVLHTPDAGANARELYLTGYSMRRLAALSARRSAHDRHSDLWEAAKIVLMALQSSEPQLGLPALAGLFAGSQCLALDSAELENRALLLAIYKLAWLRSEAGLSKVNWRDMGPEELGSVYEGLLEMHPEISVPARTFRFSEESRGNARKMTGSYYTPDSLVQVLLDSALEPVIQETLAKNPDRPIDALLSLSIVDPACGSGHFLLAAARRLAAHIARIAAGGTASLADYRHALRQVVGRCIYGVDLNQMAVELCKVGLWMEAVEPGLPLTFLDAHIRSGNALLGTTPELMESGIPDEAWEAIEGDDKKVASRLKKRNRAERTGQLTMVSGWTAPVESGADKLRAEMAKLDALSDVEFLALSAKEALWAEILASHEYEHQKLVADAWCAAFVWPKQPDNDTLAEAAPTTGLWLDLRDGRGQVPALTIKTVEDLADRYQLFHWHLAFPAVFEKGGFDVVLGNPPWERVKLQEQEFFASRSAEIADAPNAAARKKLIADLPSTDPPLWLAWCESRRQAEGESHLLRRSSRYPLCGKGDINTYAVFAEHNSAILSPSGRAGFIGPSGIVTDDTTKDYFQALVQGDHLAAVYHFENEDRIFPEVHHAFRFVLFTIGRSATANLVFYARRIDQLKDPDRLFSLTAAEMAVLNPNTHTCPTFRSRRDAEINLAIYRRVGVLWREGDPAGNPWGIRFLRMFDMANDSGLFRTRSELEAAGCNLEGNRLVSRDGEYLPLFEAKMLHHFDHRFGTYLGQTQEQSNQGKLPELDDEAHANPNLATHSRYLVLATDVARRLESESNGNASASWGRGWLLDWRRICRSTDERTMIGSLIPRSGAADSTFLIFPQVAPGLAATLFANLCSFALDYAARQKFGGANVNYFAVKQLPVLPPADYGMFAQWSNAVQVSDWTVPRILELSYTAWDLQPFAQDVGYNGPPFRWDHDRRFLLRCELDAAFFHLYCLARDDTDYIMDTFPIVRKNDEKAHGEYRTKRVILEIYDEMAEAARTGRPYQTRLDPPPADPRVAHPPRDEGAA